MFEVAPVGGSETRPGFRWALREATRGAHQAIHELPPFRELLQGRLDKPRYGRVVAALHDFHGSTEGIQKCADQSLDYDDPDFDGRARRALIEHDLAALGLPAISCRAVLEADTRPGWNIGFSYVVRGSSIGGQVIYAALDALFGSKEDGRRFFRGPVGTGQHWTEFCARLDRLDRNKLIEDATEGAAAAFGHFRTCMEGRCLR